MKHDFKAGPAEVRKLSVVEAAIVAAGFEFREVKNPEDCPSCFSRPLLIYTIGLAKYAPEDVWQSSLAPLAARLANTADKDELELARGRFLTVQTFRRVISMFCDDDLKRPQLASWCRNIFNFCDALTEIRELSGFFRCVPVRAALLMPERSRLPFGSMHYAFEDLYQGDAEMAAYDACEAVMLCCFRGGMRRRRKYFTVAAQILDEAMMLGKP